MSRPVIQFYLDCWTVIPAAVWNVDFVEPGWRWVTRGKAFEWSHKHVMEALARVTASEARSDGPAL